ncbi:hypothetical protein H310_01880 [Aphanomyces invadans]|uniref:Cystatin domain-containing protein n=1 Tax=Aphanomyces invadans TaxID=157072 RepID=A0A024ULM2_9STRA|nr:hypothetical protein H310_01880 [Aphanomyces invadans]ETW07341.1 hypothetical protein H310_01880 [Aphanomyces invadans]|eukprot:XP_008863434.1 hypothetical protein H310_01880 [Aphanomyces invadans]
MKCALSLACVAAVASASNYHRGVGAAAPGGWTPANVEDVKKVYYSVSPTESSYTPATMLRLCATEFTSAEMQVVNGINYKLHVQACTVSSAKEATPTCSCPSGASKAYAINLFKDPNEVTKVSNIELDTPADGTPTTTPETKIGGASAPRPVTEDDKAIFTRATSDEANYASSQLARVCASEFISVSTQVVAGMNYIFTVKGCALEKAPLATADCKTTCASKQAATFQIKVFAGLDNTVKVSGVSSAAGSPELPSNSASGVEVANSTATTPATPTPTATTVVMNSAATGLSLGFTVACLVTAAAAVL